MWKLWKLWRRFVHIYRRELSHQTNNEVKEETVEWTLPEGAKYIIIYFGKRWWGYKFTSVEPEKINNRAYRLVGADGLNTVIVGGGFLFRQIIGCEKYLNDYLKPFAKSSPDDDEEDDDEDDFDDELLDDTEVDYRYMIWYRFNRKRYCTYSLNDVEVISETEVGFYSLGGYYRRIRDDNLELVCIQVDSSNDYDLHDLTPEMCGIRKVNPSR
jgi:hypothetical protein